MSGKVTGTKDRMKFKASVSGQVFLLAEDPASKQKKKKDGKSPYEKLRHAIESGAKIDRVIGRVQEPKVKKRKPKPPTTILVTGFRIVEKVKE